MNKVILITGGTDGLGKALAQSLHSQHTIVILGRNARKCGEVAKEIGCDWVAADVGDYSQVEKAIQATIARHGRIDCLVNNAGIWIEGTLEENSPEAILEVLQTNTLGTIFPTKATIPFMKQHGSGRIIMVNSQAGLHPKAKRSVYKASKYGMKGFTDSIRMELAPFNISVCGFYPGAMKTDFFAKATDAPKDLERHMDLSEVVRALTFLIETDESLTIPEFGIKPVGH